MTIFDAWDRVSNYEDLEDFNKEYPRAVSNDNPGWLITVDGEEYSWKELKGNPNDYIYQILSEQW